MDTLTAIRTDLGIWFSDPKNQTTLWDFVGELQDRVDDLTKIVEDALNKTAHGEDDTTGSSTPADKTLNLKSIRSKSPPSKRIRNLSSPMHFDNNSLQDDAEGVAPTPASQHQPAQHAGIADDTSNSASRSDDLADPIGQRDRVDLVYREQLRMIDYRSK